MCQDHFSHISICAMVALSSFLVPIFLLFPIIPPTLYAQGSSCTCCWFANYWPPVTSTYPRPHSLPDGPIANAWRLESSNLRRSRLLENCRLLCLSLPKIRTRPALLNLKHTRAPRRPVLDVFVGECIRGVLAHPPPTQSRPGPARQTTELLINGGAVKGSRRVINWAQDLICNVLMKWERG